MHRALAILLALSASHAATAQTRPSAQNDTIIVEGRKEKPAKQARRFIDQVISGDDLRLARFDDPVCVQVAGLTPQYNAALAARYLSVAEATGVKLAAEPCEPNILVLVVEDTQSFVKLARKRYNRLFGRLTDEELRNAMADSPVRSWRKLVTMDDMGRIVPTLRVTFINDPRNDPVNQAAMEAGGSVPVSFPTKTHAASLNAVIVLDREVTYGKSIAQIADYAAMRTLAGARPPSKGTLALPSILNLFDAGATPLPEISDVDLELLGGLYRSKELTDHADIEIDRIAKQMVASRTQSPAPSKGN